MEKLVRAGDFVSAARSAHALKGSAANVGAQRLAEAARDIETHSKRNDLIAATDAVARLAAIYAETRAALEARVAARD